MLLKELKTPVPKEFVSFFLIIPFQNGVTKIDLGVCGSLRKLITILFPVLSSVLSPVGGFTFKTTNNKSNTVKNYPSFLP